MTPTEWFENVAYSGLGYRTSKEATYDIAMLALQRGIPGDFVECGVYAGSSSALMARALIEHARATEQPPLLPKITRRVHLFDSFEGMPEAGAMDAEILASYGETCKGQVVCPLEDVKKNMHRWGIPEELLVYHPGWLEQTVPELAYRWYRIASEKIAVLRLDADLYSPTKVCMQYLFPLVSPGGWVIVDDFNLSGCRQAVFEHVAPAPIYFRVPEKI